VLRNHQTNRYVLRSIEQSPWRHQIEELGLLTKQEIAVAAPDEFRYKIRSEAVTRTLEGDRLVALQRVVEGLRNATDDASVIDVVKNACDGLELGRQDFFPVMYDLLIDREKGPRLTTLVATMGAARALPLLEPSGQVECVLSMWEGVALFAAD